MASAVNVPGRVAVLDSGETIAFSTMFDFDGDETDDADQAVSVVAPLPTGGWAVILLDEFERVPLQ